MSADWDAAFLLEPISAEEPCGKNLEETDPLVLSAFDEYELWGQTTLDVQKDDLTQKEIKQKHRPPEWREIKNLALDALRTSKDLRLLAYLGVSVLRTDGIPAFASTLDVASQWLEQQWAGVHPLADDVFFRKNTLNNFADTVAVVDGLRKTPLVRSRAHGEPSLRDMELPGQFSDEQIREAFGSTPLADLTALSESVTRAQAALKNIDGIMRREGGIEGAPSFEPLVAQLKKMDGVLQTELARHPGRVEADAPEGAAGGDGAVGVGGGVAVGAIKSRQDAIRALDAVAEFFRRNEPSSPIPMFLDRAKRLVSKDFFEVLADVAPDAVATAKLAGGVKSE